MVVIRASDYDNLELLRMLNSCGDAEMELTDVCGQRYLGCGMSGNQRIIIHGTAGNNLGAFAEGPFIAVHGNAQDGVANTMSDGCIVIHGRAGDVLGYGMRGGEVYVRGDAGYRLGIHMKAFGDKAPVIVVGGAVGAFAGEYMAGGTIVVLDLEETGKTIGPYCGTGMYGGQILVRGLIDPEMVAPNVKQEAVDVTTETHLLSHLAAFSRFFDIPMSTIMSGPFTRLSTLETRPFARLYRGFVS